MEGVVSDNKFHVKRKFHPIPLGGFAYLWIVTTPNNGRQIAFFQWKKAIGFVLEKIAKGVEGCARS